MDLLVTHSLSHSPTHSPTHSFTHSLTPSLPRLLVGSYTVPHEARANIINLEVNTALTSSDATHSDIDLTSEGKEESEGGTATTNTNTLQNDANKSTLENSLSRIDGAKKGQRILLQRKNPLADAKSPS